jgi:hypothetical protein
MFPSCYYIKIRGAFQSKRGILDPLIFKKSLNVTLSYFRASKRPKIRLSADRKLQIQRPPRGRNGLFPKESPEESPEIKIR